jgi:Ca2+-binding EF-hand superfamily protein
MVHYFNLILVLISVDDESAVYTENLRDGANKDIKSLLDKPIHSDDESLNSAVSSILDNSNLLMPLVPYRISDHNMKLMNSIFNGHTDPLEQTLQYKNPPLLDHNSNINIFDDTSQSLMSGIGSVSLMSGGASFSMMSISENEDEDNEFWMPHSNFHNRDRENLQVLTRGKNNNLSNRQETAVGKARNAVLFSRKAKRPMSVPKLPMDTIAATRAKLSVTSGDEPSDFDNIFNKIDPLALSLSVSLKKQAKNELKEFNSKIIQKNKSKQNNLKAEKLIDLEFIRRLFSDKISLEESISIVRRLQDLLELIDKDASGYVSWETFSRVILAVAPPNLLRAHVDSFLEAQTDNTEDMLDYREFIITGKVIIVQRNQPSSNFDVPISSWIHRQKLVTGDKSTHTWQNHIEWYRARKANAVVWLMRRAGRAVQYHKRAINAEQFLKYTGQRSKCLIELLLCGKNARVSLFKRFDAENALIKRCLHARLWRIIQGEAIDFLRKKVKIYYHDLDGDINWKRNNAAPSHNTIYKIYCCQQVASKFLAACGKEALARIDRKFDAMIWLRSLGRRAHKQVDILTKVQGQLLEIANLAYQHCYQQDTTMYSLIRIGQEKALPLMIRQENVLQWLLKRGHDAQIYLDFQECHYKYLSNYAQKKLILCNKREEALKYTRYRTNNAIRIVEMKREAFAYLSHFGQSQWQVYEVQHAAYLWLVKRGKRALVHKRLVDATYKKLKVILSIIILFI